jgi:hypothetical protein
MTEYTDEPLIAREVQIRHTEQDKLKTHQRKEMENRRIAAPQSAWNQSVAASTDDYMKSALSKVRESSVTLPDTLTRHNGSWMYSNK